MSGSAAEHFPLEKPDEEWRRELTPEAYGVLRGHGTERAGSSPLNTEKRAHPGSGGHEFEPLAKS